MATRWSCRKMAAALGVSKSTVQRVWAMVLRSQGWTVLETDNQTQAYDACLENNGAIKLLLMDFELKFVFANRLVWDQI